MPRNGSGTYTLPQSAFTPGTTISSTAVNSDLSDIAAALTQSISADGQTPLTGSLKFASGTSALPGVAFAADASTGLYLPAAGKFGLSAGGILLFQGDKSQWGVSDNPFTNPGGAVLCPVGTIMDWPGSSAPTGWLLLYGQVISQTTYPGLYAVISTTYNTGGEGAGNFRLPDCRGRVAAGKDDMGGVAANRLTNAGSGITGTTLGANGGAQNETLVSGNMPQQTFTPSGTIGGSQTTSSNLVLNLGGGPSGFGGGVNSFGINGSLTINGSNFNFTGNPTTIGNASPTAVTTTQPTIIFNKIIFAGR